jgi:hypothetical protein
MHLIAEDAAGLFAEATPVGVMGAAQDAWEKGVSVEVTPTSVVSVVENAQPYLYYVVHGSAPARGNPGGFLVPWVDKKLTVPQQYAIARRAGMDEKAARGATQRSNIKFGKSSLTVSVAFIIGRARMRRGSKPRDFITPIAERRMPFWQRILQTKIFPGGVS